MVSAGLELRLETPKPEEPDTGSVKQGGLYDADDEEGESSEVILSRGSGAITEAADTATPLLPHQDLVFKRKRPNPNADRRSEKKSEVSPDRTFKVRGNSKNGWRVVPFPKK